MKTAVRYTGAGVGKPSQDRPEGPRVIFERRCQHRRVSGHEPAIASAVAPGEHFFNVMSLVARDGGQIACYLARRARKLARSSR